ncbi:MAG: hypothetical protein IJN46_01965, partial [Lachnospiraceae bacterium]|nr:hypothetical protein [Lachnospiraceae bacterium]
NQTFIFRIEGNGVDLTVTIHGDDEITITGLTVGNTYTVTEETDWSWRYDFASWAFATDGDTDAEGNTNDASVTLGATGNTITFTNTRSNKYWLDGDSYKVNIYNANASSQE